MSALGWSLPAGCSTLPCESEGAYEVKINGQWVACDEDNNVYLQTNSVTARDDGYEFVGKMEMLTDDFDSELRQFVNALTKG